MEQRIKRAESNWLNSHKTVCELDYLANEFVLVDQMQNCERIEKDLEMATNLRGKMAEIYLNTIIEARFSISLSISLKNR